MKKCIGREENNNNDNSNDNNSNDDDNNSKHVYSVYYMLGTVQSALCALTYLIFTTTLQGRCYYYPYFTDEEPEALID